MNELLRIVHVEDSEEDVELIKHSLLREGYSPEVRRVETRSELLDALTHTECDLILSDYTLPKFSGKQALEISHALKPETPFIFVSAPSRKAPPSNRSATARPTTSSRTARRGSSPPSVARSRKSANPPCIPRSKNGWHQARRLQAVSTLAGDVARDVSRLLVKIRNQAHSLTANARNPHAHAIFSASSSTPRKKAPS